MREPMVFLSIYILSYDFTALEDVFSFADNIKKGNCHD